MILVISKNRLLGMSFAVALISYGYSMIYLNTVGFEVPVCLDVKITVNKVVRFMDAVHFPTYGHLPDYMSGLLVAYAYRSGVLQKWNPNVSLDEFEVISFKNMFL